MSAPALDIYNRFNRYKTFYSKFRFYLYKSCHNLCNWNGASVRKHLPLESNIRQLHFLHKHTDRSLLASTNIFIFAFWLAIYIYWLLDWTFAHFVSECFHRHMTNQRLTEHLHFSNHYDLANYHYKIFSRGNLVYSAYIVFSFDF